MQLLDLRHKYSYYCKIELLPGTIRYRPDQGGKAEFTGGLPDAKLSLQAVTDFISAALPELLRCLPDGEAIR